MQYHSLGCGLACTLVSGYAGQQCVKQHPAPARRDLTITYIQCRWVKDPVGCKYTLVKGILQLAYQFHGDVGYWH